MGGRRSVAGFSFLIQLLEEGGVVEGAGAKVELFNTARAKSERRQRTEGLPGVGRWPDTEILAGKGSGHSPPPSR